MLDDLFCRVFVGKILFLIVVSFESEGKDFEVVCQRRGKEMQQKGEGQE